MGLKIIKILQQYHDDVYHKEGTKIKIALLGITISYMLRAIYNLIVVILGDTFYDYINENNVAATFNLALFILLVEYLPICT